MNFAHVNYEVRGRVAEITMRRAPVNAPNHALMEEINTANRTAKDE